ncbi:MAG: DUF2231 domain-containing protein [bacterium]
MLGKLSQSFISFALLIAMTGGVSVWAHGDQNHSSGRTESETSVSIRQNGKGKTKAGRSENQRTNGNTSVTQSAQEDHKSTRNQVDYSKGHDHAESKPDSWFETLLPGLAGAPNVHPMLVHFPIVFLWTALLFITGSWFGRRDQFLIMAKWLFWLGLFTLPLTATSGFLAVGGWGGGHVTVHRNLMVATTVLAFLLFAVLRIVAGQKRLYRIVMTIGLVVVVAVMSLGADRGAWLVFVKGSGVQPAPHVHNH